MKRFLLLASLLIITAIGWAQTTSSKFTFEIQQKTDDMVTLSWKSKGLKEKTIFHVTKYMSNAGANWAGEVAVERKIENTSESTLYSCNLDGLDLTGQIKYKFSVKTIDTLSTGEVQKVEAFLMVQNGTAKAINELDFATPYTFTYGLQTPTLSEKKSSSVNITWNSTCSWGTPAFYTVFEIKTNKQIATTTTTSYVVTDLIAEKDYSFFVRAYDANGAYLSSSPDVTYTPETVECLTFTEAYIEITEGIYASLIFDFLGAYDIYEIGSSVNVFMGDEEGAFGFSPEDDGSPFFVWFTSDIDVTKEFRVETKNKNNGHKAVGFFKLNDAGTEIEEQRCDIVFDLWTTHITQYTVSLEWTDPGFVPGEATVIVTNNKTKVKEQEIKLANPKVLKYSVGNLEHSTEYIFELKLKDDYLNMAKKSVTATTKVGNICEVTNETSRLGLGCSNEGEFVAPYDIEFYTEYEDNGQAKVTVRFRLLDATEISKVQLIYTKEGNIISEIINLKRIDMTKGSDGWYSTTFTKLGSTDMKDGEGMYFSVILTPAKRCSYLLNVYITKLISYTVGVGCQDEAVYKKLSFTKTKESQTQYTLQTTGRIASVGVFPNENYNVSERMFYNNFDDAPASFTLDISEYPIGTYYLHIHDVYGEAEDLKYLWAIY